MYNGAKSSGITPADEKAWDLKPFPLLGKAFLVSNINILFYNLIINLSRVMEGSGPMKSGNQYIMYNGANSSGTIPADEKAWDLKPFPLLEKVFMYIELFIKLDL